MIGICCIVVSIVGALPYLFDSPASYAPGHAIISLFMDGPFMGAKAVDNFFELVVWAALCYAYVARYEEHRVAGLKKIIHVKNFSKNSIDMAVSLSEYQFLLIGGIAIFLLKMSRFIIIIKKC